MCRSPRRRVIVAVARLTRARAAWSSCPSSVASANASSSIATPRSSLHCSRVVPTLVSACKTVSRSPMRRASASARVPSEIASSWLSASIASWDRALSAIASSRLSGNASSTAIARSASSVASGPCPAHHRIRDSQRRSSPTRSSSPAASWSASRARRASSARSRCVHRYASSDTPSSASGSAPPDDASAASQCSSDSRWPPSAAAARAAGGASRRIASASAERRAWWASRAGSGSGPASSARRTRALSSRRRTGEMASSAARRARSCRYATASPCRTRSPAAMHSSISAAPAPMVSASSDRSAGPGTTAASSTTARASSPTTATRNPTASRTLAGTRSPAGAASSSVTKNGLPPDSACSSDASRPARRASTPTASAVSAPGSTTAQAIARQRAQDAPHLGALLRTARDDQAAPGAGQPAAQQRHEVQRGVVGPVQVLDDERAGIAAQLVEHGGQQVLPGRLERRRHPPADLTRDVMQRTHRPRRDQRVAGAPQHPPALRHGRHERGLADPGLARDDHHPPADAGLLDRRLQRLALAVTLEKLHGGESR